MLAHVDHPRGAHRESIHSRKCCLDMPTAFATCKGAAAGSVLHVCVFRWRQ